MNRDVIMCAIKDLKNIIDEIENKEKFKNLSEKSESKSIRYNKL